RVVVHAKNEAVGIKEIEGDISGSGDRECAGEHGLKHGKLAHTRLEPVPLRYNAAAEISIRVRDYVSKRPRIYIDRTRRARHRSSGRIEVHGPKGLRRAGLRCVRPAK